MNEDRIIFRNCSACGKEIEVKLSSKKHWWQKRKILEGDYFFFSGSGIHYPLRSRWSWTTKFLGLDLKSKSRVSTFLSDHIWWWSIPEEECSVPNWKKPYYMLRQWIEDKLDPPEKAEYWECEGCFNKPEPNDTVEDFLQEEIQKEYPPFYDASLSIKREEKESV